MTTAVLDEVGHEVARYGKPTPGEHDRFRMLVVGQNPSVQHFAVRGSGLVTLCSYDMSQTTQMHRPLAGQEFLPACVNCREVAAR